MMSSPAVRVSDLYHSYRDGDNVQPVISNTTMQIMPGECVALLGRSGSGKSTLLNLIGGIDRPDSGHVSVHGQDISTLNEPGLTVFRRRHIGFVYQFFNLIPTLTALENVALPLELNAYPKADIAGHCQDMLEAVGLQLRPDAHPDQLSGGEQQRIAIARALIHKPSIVLADEPTGNLDHSSGENVIELMTSLVKQERSSLLLVTHSLAVAGKADRILTLENGVVSEQESGFAW